MDFARNLLMKYGWKEGEGIGKNADGILQPIRPSLKFDKAGLSFDKAREFTDHWWERAFNSAASNLNVDNSIGNVSLSVKDIDSTEISTSSFSAKKIKKQAKVGDKSYQGCFEKSKNKLNQESNTEPAKEDINGVTSMKVLTDEDILMACGGRTAHKGARHGLSLNGKLSRIDAQNQEMLKKSLINTNTAQDVFNDWIRVTKKRKDKKHKKEKKILNTYEDSAKTTDNSPESNKLASLLSEDDYKIKYKSKKHKKQQRDRDEDLAKSFSTLNDKGKAIKKEKRLKARKNHIKNSRNESREHIIMTESTETTELKATRIPKQNIILDHMSSDCSGSEEHDDPLVQHISNLVESYPNKKFKVIAEKLTPIQKKKLRKSGLRVDFKKPNKKKSKKEKAKIDKISKRIQNSMCFEN